MTPDEAILKLHQTYCQETKLVISCTMARHFTWEAFIERKFTLEDLVLVCRNLRYQVSTGRRKLSCLGFSRLIGDLENFEEFLAEFRALQRKPSYAKGKEAVLRATNRPSQPDPSPERKARDVIKGLDIAARLRDFKNKL